MLLVFSINLLSISKYFPCKLSDCQWTNAPHLASYGNNRFYKWIHESVITSCLAYCNCIIPFLHCPDLKSGYLNFSHLTDIYITEIYIKKQYKSSITKNNTIRKKHIF